MSVWLHSSPLNATDNIVIIKNYYLMKIVKIKWWNWTLMGAEDSEKDDCRGR